uniref:Uncharacterized protein n=1 Tax=Ananas comosus var. bracteatus TaxID=296719 RepID=A0A6V7NSD0_ANACO|nr:unnamed protein product [Ananas comosus var. bracteatus]
MLSKHSKTMRQLMMDPVEACRQLGRVSGQVRVALASNRRKTGSVRREGSFQRRILQNSRFLCLLYRYNQRAVPVQPARTGLPALGLALVPVQEPVYRYKGEKTCDLDLSFIKLPDLALGAVIKLYCRRILETSTPGSLEYIYARAGMPSGFLQGRSGCFGLLGAVRVDGGPVSPCWRQIVPRARYLLSLIELDRDTMHTRLGSAYECHSGVGLCAFALVSLMPVGLALHRPVSVEVAGQSQRGRDGCIHSPRDSSAGNTSGKSRTTGISSNAGAARRVTSTEAK